MARRLKLGAKSEGNLDAIQRHEEGDITSTATGPGPVRGGRGRGTRKSSDHSSFSRAVAPAKAAPQEESLLGAQENSFAAAEVNATFSEEKADAFFGEASFPGRTPPGEFPGTNGTTGPSPPARPGLAGTNRPPQAPPFSGEISSGREPPARKADPDPEDELHAAKDP